MIAFSLGLFVLIGVLAHLDQDDYRELADRVRAALGKCGIQQKDAAFRMGISEGLLSRQLSGAERISLQQLSKLPLEFWQWFHLLGVKDAGLPAEVGTGLQLAMTLTVQGERR